MRCPGNRGAGLLTAFLIGALVSAGCSEPTSEASTTEAAVTSTVGEPATTAPEPGYLAALPDATRASNGGGDPRPPAYWMLWNTCAPENRAAEAEANGGRAEGWVLVDDVLADPGIQLGDHVLDSCDESVALLEGRTVTDEATEDPVYALAAQLLAAELNLSAGAETCSAAEEAVIAAHIVLAGAGFDGVSDSPLDSEAGGALPQIVDLLAAYNSGTLCV